MEEVIEDEVGKVVQPEHGGGGEEGLLRHPEHGQGDDEAHEHPSPNVSSQSRIFGP